VGPRDSQVIFALARIQTVDHPAHSLVSTLAILSWDPLTRYRQFLN